MGTTFTEPGPRLDGMKVVHAVCSHDCPDSCGVLVTVDEATGRAVKMQGDPSHPVTRGFLCGKVAKYLDRVYSPDRLLYPMSLIGYSSPSGEYTRSKYFATFPHRNPRVTGCDGSPCIFTARPVASSTVTSTPHESGQSCEQTACTTFIPSKRGPGSVNVVPIYRF